MSAVSKCPKCYDEAMGCNTGEVGQGGYLDCLCGAAESRRAMEVALSISEAPTWMRDTAWRAYCMGAKLMLDAQESATYVPTWWADCVRKPGYSTGEQIDMQNEIDALRAILAVKP